MSSIVRIIAAFALLAALSTPSHAFLTSDEIATRQKEMASMRLGARIAGWAEAFIGTSYDTDPLGAYVSERAVVVDSSADCMYLTFRSVELASTESPGDAVRAALNMRFITRGKLGPDGKVLNYDERYQYAMDMIKSGKWGKDITTSLLPEKEIIEVPGDRHHGPVSIIPKNAVNRTLSGLQSGDIVFFIKEPSRRVVGEIVGHIGIIADLDDAVFLIHASGRKNKDGRPSGQVVKVPITAYAKKMPFIGVVITRFTE